MKRIFSVLLILVLIFPTAFFVTAEEIEENFGLLGPESLVLDEEEEDDDPPDVLDGSLIHGNAVRVGEKYVDVDVYTQNDAPPATIQGLRINSRTIVPLREFFETIGAEVYWNESEQSIYVSRNSYNVKMFVGRRFAYVDGKRTSLEMSPFIMNNNAMIPFRFAAESLNMKVSFDQETDRAYVNTEIFHKKPITAEDKDFDGLDCIYSDDNFSLWATLNSTELHILVDGIASTSATIYLDCDNNPETGLNVWQWYDFGAEYALSRDGLTEYKFSTEDDSNGTAVTSSARYTPKSGRLIARIPHKSLSFNENSSIKIGVYARNLTERQSVPEKKADSILVGPPKLFKSIPYAIGMGIDDLGWLRFFFKNSDSGHTRDADIQDYMNIVQIGKNVGTRIMTAWILGDLDLDGSIITDPLRNPPYSNSYLTGYGLTPDPVPVDYVRQIMNLVGESAAYMEFGLHGVGHENFYPGDNGKVLYNRAEWARKTGKGTSEPWEDHTMDIKAQAYLDIIRQFFDEETCSFPTAFVPPAHGYFYEAGNPRSTGHILGKWGVKYANFSTPNATNIGKGVIDGNILAIDRAPGANYNYEHATPWVGDWIRFEAPAYPTDKFGWVEAHFPNYWNDRAKPYRNDAVHEWTEYLTGINASVDRILPPNTAVCSSQWLYHHYGKLESTGSQATIDLTGMLDEAYSENMLTPIIMKVELDEKQIYDLKIDNGGKLLGYYEDDFNHGYLIIGDPENHMGRLSKKRYNISYKLGNHADLGDHIDMEKSTYTLYSFTQNAGDSVISLEMYGTQEVRVKLAAEPSVVWSNNPNLTILDWNYEYGVLRINVKGKNIQGETGKIIIS